jgi:hypothetical protein
VIIGGPELVPGAASTHSGIKDTSHPKTIANVFFIIIRRLPAPPVSFLAAAWWQLIYAPYPDFLKKSIGEFA